MQIRFIGGPMDGVQIVAPADTLRYVTSVPGPAASTRQVVYSRAESVAGVTNFRIKQEAETANGRN